MIMFNLISVMMRITITAAAVVAMNEIKVVMMMINTKVMLMIK